ncbi:LOW QUALITY PROTEIN: glutathione S-transferase A4-like [Ctenodactylus gundi]
MSFNSGPLFPLLFQVPMIEIDGVKLVQTQSILHYIAEKCHHFGKSLEEKTLIDVSVEGTLDLLELLIMHSFLKPEDQKQEGVNMGQESIIRYFPNVFEKKYCASVAHLVLHISWGHELNFLVGNHLSLIDVILLQTILVLEEKICNILMAFPLLQECTVKSNIPTIKRLLEPGNQKQPLPDEICVRTIYGIFRP